MRPHTVAEAPAVCDTVARWQEVFASVLGRRMVFAADEYYLLAEREMPPADSYEGFPQHENGIGMVRAFERAFAGRPLGGAGGPARLLLLGRRGPADRLPGATRGGTLRTEGPWATR